MSYQPAHSLFSKDISMLSWNFFRGQLAEILSVPNQIIIIDRNEWICQRLRNLAQKRLKWPKLYVIRFKKSNFTIHI